MDVAVLESSDEVASMEGSGANTLTNGSSIGCANGLTSKVLTEVVP